MASFIELPRLDFRGRDVPSLYVNTADIISLQALWDGQTQLDIRDLGAERLSVRVTTYAPLNSLLDVLGSLAQFPGVRSWTHDTCDAWAEPHRARLAEAYEREHAAR